MFRGDESLTEFTAVRTSETIALNFMTDLF